MNIPIVITAGITIPLEYSYGGAVITSVSKNGWCKGYYPSNVVEGNIEDAMFSARAHWLVGVNTEYTIYPN